MSKTPPKKTAQGFHDPDTYARLNKPFPSMEAAETATKSFFEAVYAARIKWGVADAYVLTKIDVHDAEEPRALVMTQSYGDSRNRLPMVASAFRALREEDREQWLEMAGLLNDPDIIVPTGKTATGMHKLAEQLTAKTGERWTAGHLLDLMANQRVASATAIAAITDVAARKPMPPAEEVAALSGALREMLEATAGRAQKIVERIEELRATIAAAEQAVKPKVAPEDIPAPPASPARPQ